MHLAYNLCKIPLDDVDLLKHLFLNICSKIQHLHWDQLKADSIDLSINSFGKRILKIQSDLVAATPVDSCSGQVSITSTADHAKALALLVYFVKMWRNQSQQLEIKDFLDAKDIEMNMLMLALQERLTPEEALLTPSFQNELTKKTILEELNAFIKQLKCEKSKNVKVLEEVERNSSLSIGGEGLWNVKLAREIQDEFAINNGNSYDLVSFADLLRIIRNIFQHGHECPKAMLAAFGTKHPSPTQMMSKFFDQFPFFYLHSLSCFTKMFESRPDSVTQLYIDVYVRFETTLCNRGLVDGTIRSLKEHSVIKVSFESATEDAVEHVINIHGKTRSCVDVFVDLIPKISKKALELWRDVSLDSLVIRSCGKDIKVPNAATPESQPSADSSKPVCLLLMEGLG